METSNIILLRTSGMLTIIWYNHNLGYNYNFCGFKVLYGLGDYTSICIRNSEKKIVMES